MSKQYLSRCNCFLQYFKILESKARDPICCLQGTEAATKVTFSVRDIFFLNFCSPRNCHGTSYNKSNAMNRILTERVTVANRTELVLIVSKKLEICKCVSRRRQGSIAVCDNIFRNKYVTSIVI